MIIFTRKDKVARISIENGPLNYTFHFDFNANDDVYAELLSTNFRNRFYDLIQDVRKEEYNRGYKDGRAKRAKATWFYAMFKKYGY